MSKNKKAQNESKSKTIIRGQQRRKKRRDKPSYFAIIPAKVRYCEALAPIDKLLFGEITALANTKSYCFASNDYFADLYDMHKITISKSISKLVQNNFIRTELIYAEGTKQVKERRIYIDQNAFGPVDNTRVDIDDSTDISTYSEKLIILMVKKLKRPLLAKMLRIIKQVLIKQVLINNNNQI